MGVLIRSSPTCSTPARAPFCCAAPPTRVAMTSRTSAWPAWTASPCCTNTLRAWRRARGTRTASSAWWWRHLPAEIERACAPLRRRCRLLIPVWVPRAATLPPRCARAGGLMARSSSTRPRHPVRQQRRHFPLRAARATGAIPLNTLVAFTAARHAVRGDAPAGAAARGALAWGAPVSCAAGAAFARWIT